MDGHEGAARTLGPLVDGPRHQILAGPALPEDQDGGVRGGHPLDHAEDLLHPGRTRQDAAERLGSWQARAQGHIVAQELSLLGCLADDHLEFLDPGGLGQVVIGAQLHGLDGARNLLEACHHDHLRLFGKTGQLPQDLNAFLARHLHVEDDHVVRRLAQTIERGLPVRHPLHLMALTGQLAHHQLAQVLLVVGHENTDGPAHAGSTTRNRLPFPSRDVTSIRPPWSATIPWAIARPSPVPWPGGFVVKKGSKILPSSSSEIP